MKCISTLAKIGCAAAALGGAYALYRHFSQQEETSKTPIHVTNLTPTSSTESAETQTEETTTDPLTEEDAVVTPTDDACKIVEDMVGCEEEVAVDSEIAEEEEADEVDKADEADEASNI